MALPRTRGGHAVLEWHPGGTALAVYIGRRGSPLAVSLVSMSYFLGLMLFSPVWGAIADVTGRRRAVLLVTGFGATVAVLSLTVVDGVWGPIELRALYAAFAAGFAAVVLAIVSTYGGRSGRGRSIGVFNSARSSGFAGDQLTAGFLLGLLVPAELYLVVAGMAGSGVFAILAAAATLPATVTSYETSFAAGSVLALGAAVLVAVALVESHTDTTPLRPVPGDD